MSGRKRRQALARQPLAPLAATKKGRRPAQTKAGTKAPTRTKDEDAEDLYDAEEAIGDETKNPYRYDHVDNYEYELPSDFEDEEIDEEAAFTAEDKKKYGAWFDDEDAAPPEGFGDEPDEEEDEGEGADEEEGSEGVDLLDSDDEPPTKAAQQRSSSRSKKAAADEEDEEGGEDGGDEGQAGQDDNDDDDFLNEIDSEDFDGQGDEDEDEEGEEGEDEEGADGRHRDMLAVVTGRAASQKLGAGEKRRQQQQVISEAVPESEFNLNPGASSAGTFGELTVADLMRGLSPDERRKMTPSSRKLLEKLATTPHPAPTPGGSKRDKKDKAGASGSSLVAPVAAPLPRLIKERQERKAGYEDTKEDVTKWQPIVKANREAATLVFTSARGEVPRTTTAQSIAVKHTPETELEEEVAALLAAAGAANTNAVQEAEEKLAMKHLTLEEVKARQERLAKMRALLFYQEIKAKRMKSIKSKDYHKRQAKAEKHRAQKLAGADGGGGELLATEEDAAAAREAEAAAEFDRAKERLTLKHRNTSKWARRALKRGVEVMDEGTKEALAEQLRMGQALRRKIEGGRGAAGSGDEEDDGSDATSASGDEGGDADEPGRPGVSGSRKAREAALQILKGSAAPDELPKKGLFTLPFMARAMERQRLQVQEQATELVQQLDAAAGGAGRGEQEAAAGPAAVKRMKFGSGAVVESEATPFGFEDVGGDEEDEEEDVEAKAERLGLRLAGGEAAGGSGRKPAEKQQAGKQQRRRAPTVEEVEELEAVLEGRAVVSSAGRELGAGAAVGGGAEREQRSGGAAAGGVNGISSAAVVQASRADLFSSQPRQQQQRGGQGQPATGGQAPGFIASKAFAGSKPGYSFKKGPQGVGYYVDLVGAAQGREKGAAAPAGSKASAALEAAAGRARQHRQQRRGIGEGDATAAGEEDEEEGAEEAGAREGMRPAPLDPAAAQRELVSMAFAGDDVEAEFEAEKVAAVSGELPAVEAPSALPGWGMWSGSQREPKWMRDAKLKAAADLARAAAARQDARLRNVVISEKWDKKAAKYLTPAVPFPFDSKAVYEGSMVQPLGREFNPDTSFRDMVRPAVLKATGVVIAPARFTVAGAKGAAEGCTVGRAGVATVAGGRVLTAGGGKAGKERERAKEHEKQVEREKENKRQQKAKAKRAAGQGKAGGGGGGKRVKTL